MPVLADFAELLARYVVACPDGVNRVRYAAWAASPADRARLARTVEKLEGEAPSLMAPAEALAFWANLYNALTLLIVLEHYPIRSIREIRTLEPDGRERAGPWRMERVTVERRRLSLHEIEHRILRQRFKDPRIHYAINCASLSCPNLPAQPWEAATLDENLDAAARSYINHPRALMRTQDGQIRASGLFDWYADDFGGSAGVLAHQAEHANPGLGALLRAAARIDAFDYDWSLNEFQD